MAIKSIRRTTNQAGFTLLETMIAVSIMLVAFSAILMVESSALNITRRSKDMTIVAMLAKRTMVDTEQVIEGKAFNDIGKEETGQFEAPYQEYRWTRVIKEIEFPNLAVEAPTSSGSKSAAEESSSEAAGILSKVVTKFLSKAVREVTVTVLWKKGSGDQSFAVSTYWVDLNNEFDFTE